MNTRARRIVLTGFMCAGKTTVARALAARLNCAWLDTDAVIVERTGRSVEAIIEADGEACFRRIEHEVLRDCLEREEARVVALGGGTWTLPENRALIAAHSCLTVWLDAPFALCWRRIVGAQASGQPARPLARRHDEAHALYAARRELYSLAAWRVRSGETQSAEDTATEIVSIIERADFPAQGIERADFRAEETTNLKGREEDNANG